MTEHEETASRPQPALRQRDGDQPLPTPNHHPAIVDLVTADLESRRQLGIARYGTALQPYNGRDALRDAYEELLDGACYLRQQIYERDHTEQPEPARACLLCDCPGCTQCNTPERNAAYERVLGQPLGTEGATCFCYLHRQPAPTRAEAEDVDALRKTDEPAPLGDDALDAIEARASRGCRCDDHECVAEFVQLVDENVPALIAEVKRLRGRPAEPTGVMTVPLANRTEAIRRQYHDFHFSGPTALDRERDQVVGHLLSELRNRDDELERLRAQQPALTDEYGLRILHLDTTISEGAIAPTYAEALDVLAEFGAAPGPGVASRTLRVRKVGPWQDAKEADRG